MKNENTEKSDIVTGPEMVLSAIGIVTLIVPLFLLRIHPDKVWVQAYLGGGRVFLIWGVVFGVFYWIEMALRKRKKSSSD